MIDDSLSRRIIIYAAIGGASGILMGTFGAHSLEAYCEMQGYSNVEQRSDWIDTGVQYHLIHALALLALAGLPFGSPSSRQWVSRLFLLGILLFSGGLYGLAISNARELVWLPPIGGVAWIVGWLLLLVVSRRATSASRDRDRDKS